MQDNDCQHEIWYAGVIDTQYALTGRCKCLDCGFEKVVSISEIGRENVVTVNEKLNTFKPVTFERVQQVYNEFKNENKITAKLRIRRKYDIR
jgi:hypothetical protein